MLYDRVGLYNGKVKKYMIKPDKVRVEAKKRENENFKFCTFLKCHVDEDELDSQFLRLHKELLQIMTAANAEIAARCIKEVFRQKILTGMRNI